MYGDDDENVDDAEQEVDLLQLVLRRLLPPIGSPVLLWGGELVGAELLGFCLLYFTPIWVMTFYMGIR